MRLRELLESSPPVLENELEEGWKDVVSNLAIAGAIGAGGGAGIAAKDAWNGVGDFSQKAKTVQAAPTAKQEPAKLEIPPKQAPAKVAPPAEKPAPKKIEVNLVTDNPLEKVLLQVAKREGLKGAELAAFMAQCAHETMDFRSLVEFGGSLDFRKYDRKYNPKKAKDLGNTKVGDGAKYKGRGFIQITGRYNYKKAGQELGLPLEKHPELVQKPDIAAKVAVWFWKHRVQPNVDNFHNVADVTKSINPGMRGLSDRKENFKDYMQITTH